MRRFLLVSFSAALALIAANCGSSVQVCAAGAQIGCACPNGGSGVQVCTPDSSHYGTCDCDGVNQGTSAAMSSGASSASAGPGGAGGANASGSGNSSGGNGGGVASTANTGSAASTGSSGPGGGAGPVVWMKSFGDASDYQEAHGLAVDLAGNVFVAGVFDGTVDFGDGPHTSAGFGDAFFTKFDSSGNVLFSKTFGDTESDTGDAVAIDGNDNVIFGGSVAGVIDFGGGIVPGSDMTADIAIAKFDNLGSYVWGKRFGGAAGTGAVTGLLASKDGDVVVTGNFGGAPDLGCGALLSPAPWVGGGGFTAKLDASGQCIWSKAFGGSVLQNEGVATDLIGNVFVTGYFDGQADFGGGVVGSNNNNPQYVFLTKLAPDGSHIYTKIFLSGVGSSIAVDLSGNPILSGRVNMGLDFGSGITIASGQSTNSFFAKLDTNGKAQFAKSLGNSAIPGSSVAADPLGDIFFTTQHAPGEDFGTGPLLGGGLVVAKYDVSGNAFWAKAADGGGGRALVAVNGQGHALVAGSFTTSLAIGGITLQSAGGSDIYVGDWGL